MNETGAQRPKRSAAKLLASLFVWVGGLSTLIGVVDWAVNIPAPLQVSYYIGAFIAVGLTFAVTLLDWLGTNPVILRRIVLVTSITALALIGAAGIFNYWYTPNIQWHGPVVRGKPLPVDVATIQPIVDGDFDLNKLVKDAVVLREMLRDRGHNNYSDANYLLFYSSQIDKLPKSIALKNLKSAKIGVIVIDSGRPGMRLPLDINTSVDLSEEVPITGDGRLVAVIIPVDKDDADALRRYRSLTEIEYPLETFLQLYW